MLNSTELLALARRCVHCGMCLPACPTYEVFGTEMDAPRGRIVLAKALAEGALPFTDPDLVTHFDRCLACRACEVACPSGVEFGRILELARAGLAAEHRPGRLERLGRTVLGRVIPARWALRGLAVCLWLYQKIGLQWLVRRLAFLPARLQAMEGLLPPLKLAWRASRPAAVAGRPRVAVFSGCVQDAFLSEVNLATIAVLEKSGFEVVVPEAQTCCGALHAHLGEHEQAQDLARRNIRAFEAAGVQAVVVNAGGCGGHLKTYAELLRDDPEYAEAAARFVGQVFDFSEFLARHAERRPQGTLDLRVTYADSCHLRNAQHIVADPRRLIQGIPGVTYVELEGADRCCGSAGVYNIVHPEIAGQLLDEKVEKILQTHADVVVTANTGCHFQIQAGLRRAGAAARVMHLAQLLDLSYLREEPHRAAK